MDTKQKAEILISCTLLIVTGVICLPVHADPASSGSTATNDVDQAKVGKSVYQRTCVVCHGTGVDGAPKAGDSAAWALRIAQGMETLQQHAIKGFQGKSGTMPAKGANPTLSDADVKAAVEYLVYRAPAMVITDNNTPVRLEDLGDNWHYTHDADKLPVIRADMPSLEPSPDSEIRGSRAPFCKTFKQDFLAGKFKVIEPDLQILSLNDPRLDKRWQHCASVDHSESTAKDLDRYYQGISVGMARGEAPYRFYRIPIDTNVSHDIADVVETRLSNSLAGRGDWKVDGYWQNYLWVDLKGCEIRGREQIGSPEARDPTYPDSLSMLIRYQGRVMVLSHESYPVYPPYGYVRKAKPDDPNYVFVALADLSHDENLCRWESLKLRVMPKTPNPPRP